jgi:hypothetical protein
MLGEEGVNLLVVKLATIVTLDGKDGKVKLSVGICMKNNEGNENIGFLAKRKGPEIMCIIIYNNKIIAKPRGTRCW